MKKVNTSMYYVPKINFALSKKETKKQDDALLHIVAICMQEHYTSVSTLHGFTLSGFLQ